MQRLAKGEDLALNEIIFSWQNRLMSFLWHMTHDEVIARELTQETFVRLYQSRHRYGSKGTFSSYLFRIARNLLLNHVRWQARHPSQSLQEMVENGFDVMAESRTPVEALVDAETVVEVRRAIASLPGELREALVLSTYQGFGFRELSKIAGCSEKAVEGRIYRAKQMLKEKLAPLVSN